MSEYLQEILRSAGPLLGLLAIAAYYLDRQIAKQRQRLSEESETHEGDASVINYDALDHAYQFYALSEPSFRGNFAKFLERVFLVVIFPVVLFTINKTLNRSGQIDAPEPWNFSALDLVVIFSVVLAAGLSVWQTGVFLGAAKNCARRVQSIAILLGDIFLSIKIGTFVLAAITTFWLLFSAWNQGLPEGNRMETRVFIFEGEALSNNSLGIIGVNGLPSITVQSPEEIEKGQLLSLFFGSDDVKILEEFPQDIDFSEMSKFGLDASGLVDFTMTQAVILLPEEPLRPSIKTVFSNTWSFYDNIEDGFVDLLEGKTSQIRVEQILNVAVNSRQINNACRETGTDRFLSVANYSDTRCGSYLGITPAVLHPSDWAASRYAQEFLYSTIQLSILMFPPVIASALSIWMILSGAIGNHLTRVTSRHSLIANFVSNNTSLSMVILAAIPFSVSTLF